MSSILLIVSQNGSICQGFATVTTARPSVIFGLNLRRSSVNPPAAAHRGRRNGKPADNNTGRSDQPEHLAQGSLWRKPRRGLRPFVPLYTVLLQKASCFVEKLRMNKTHKIDMTGFCLFFGENVLFIFYYV